MNLTVTRVRLHDKTNIQLTGAYGEASGGTAGDDMTNFHIYATHQINMVQVAVFQLQLVRSHFEYAFRNEQTRVTSTRHPPPTEGFEEPCKSTARSQSAITRGL